MEPNVRTAELRDAEVISALAVETYSHAFGHSLSAEDLRSHVDRELSPRAFVRILERDVVLVAELSGRLVGYAQFGAAPAAARRRIDAEFRRLYVHPGFQRRGIGSVLMKAALSHPILANAQLISLDVWVQNEGAQRFYGRHAFEPVGTRKFTVASGADTTPDIIMVRDNGAR
jgi:ribosomal protein S18 acetylase RimI-like enzyme